MRQSMSSRGFECTQSGICTPCPMGTYGDQESTGCIDCPNGMVCFNLYYYNTMKLKILRTKEMSNAEKFSVDLK